ncbi:HEAT repeat domain-containing protein [bacterium]|nr:MAG: HEAT repeat domain-containing protein [bacterium]
MQIKKMFLLLAILVSTLFSGCVGAPIKESIEDFARKDTVSLINDLKDKNPQVRRLAAQAFLEKNRGSSAKKNSNNIPTDPQGQIWRLHSHDPIERAYGARALGETGNEEVIPFLMEMFNDHTPLAWVPIGNPSMPSHPNTSPGGEAKEALVKIGKRKFDEFINAFKYKYEDEVVRENCVEILGDIGDGRGVEVLISALKDNKEAIRQRSAEALGKIKDPRAVDPLILALKDGDKGVQWAAMQVLIEINDHRIVEFLIVNLRDKNSDMRKNASYVLGNLKDPRAVDPLILALKDENKDVVLRAAEALEGFNNSRVTESLITAVKDRKGNFIYGVVEILGKLKDPLAVPPLSEALKDKDWDIRSAAVTALAEIGDPRAVEPLIDALRDGNWDTQEYVAELKKSGKRNYIIKIEIKVLKETAERIKKKAKTALCQITGKDFELDVAKWQAWWQENKERIDK